MCTPGDDTILICGTTVGSIVLFDLKDFESSSYRLDELDYNALLEKMYPNTEDKEINVEKKLKELKN
jgi:hypothetical protein